MKCLVEKMRAGALKVTTVYPIVKIAAEIQIIHPPQIIQVQQHLETNLVQLQENLQQPPLPTIVTDFVLVQKKGPIWVIAVVILSVFASPQEILKCLVKMKMKAGVLNKEPALRIVRTVVKL